MQNDEKPGRVVVVGDIVMDYFVAGTASQLDQTAAVPIVKVPADSSWMSPGGAAFAARNVVAMVTPAALVSAMGTDHASDQYMGFLSRVESVFGGNYLCKHYIARVEGYQTPQKYRTYADKRLVARYDVDDPIKVSVEDYIIDMFQRCVADEPARVILISDYDKGVCTPRVVETVLKYGVQNNVPVIVDPVAQHMSWYSGVHMVLPNTVEVCKATNQPERNVVNATKILQKRLGVKHCVTTCGADGLIVCDEDQNITRIPAIAVNAVDSCGAGDVVASAAAIGTFAGMSPELLWKTAIIAGGLSTQHCGTRAVGMHHVHRHIAGTTPTVKKMPLEYAELLRMSVALAEESVGVANVVFDILHAGHLSMLYEAAAQCNFLIVLVNGAASATKCKNRDVTALEMRCLQLSRVPYVDAIVVFDEDTPEEAIKALQPDVLIKGPELEGKEDTIPGASFVRQNGGRVHITKLSFDIHSSDIRNAAEEETNDDEKS